jgi:elongation factor Ts
VQKVSSELVQQLREKTGVGIMDCKRALIEANGDLDKAMDILREKGKAKAIKKSSRTASEGMIFTYLHMGNKLGVMMEMNCETDFVARTDEFNQLGKDLTMQIAAANPLWACIENVPEEIINKEKEIYKTQNLKEGKPEKILDRVIDGKVKKYFSDVCLLEQAFIKDPKVKIMDLITQTISKLGENITVGRFKRFKIGEE